MVVDEQPEAARVEVRGVMVDLFFNSGKPVSHHDRRGGTIPRAVEIAPKQGSVFDMEFNVTPHASDANPI